MEKALIFTGKEAGENGVEWYQLLIGCSYVSYSYDHSMDRTSFSEEVSAAFVGRIIEERSSLEVGIFNGLRINLQTGGNERIPRLEDELVAKFVEKVCDKLLTQNQRVAIPVPSRN